MHGIRIVALATLLTGALSGCAHRSELALTQWGTPCADYGLSAKACHAKFANYADYLAQASSSSAAGKGRATP
jgi:hypothetical protein